MPPPFKVKVDGNIEVSFVEQPTLLAALLEQGVDAQYHCKEGFCGACRVKLSSGQVDYNLDPLAYIDDGEILPCCCRPNSDISIEIT